MSSIYYHTLREIAALFSKKEEKIYKVSFLTHFYAQIAPHAQKIPHEERILYNSNAFMTHLCDTMQVQGAKEPCDSKALPNCQPQDNAPPPRRVIHFT